MLDETVLVLDFLLEVSVVFLELRHDEALSEMVTSVRLLDATCFVLAGLVKSLLKPDSEFLQLFVSGIQLSLNLL